VGGGGGPVGLPSSSLGGASGVEVRERDKAVPLSQQANDIHHGDHGEVGVDRHSANRGGGALGEHRLVDEAATGEGEVWRGLEGFRASKGLGN